MKKNKLLYSICFFILFCCIISIWVPKVSCLILLLGVYISMDIYVHSSAYIRQEKDHPKHKVFKSIVFLSIFILIIEIIIKLAIYQFPQNLVILDDLQFYLFIFLVVVYGNSAPKLPFNKFLGLRLPWTIRNEEVWMYAHRVCGFAAFPTAALMFLMHVSDMKEMVILILVFGMVFVPGIASYQYAKRNKFI